MRIYIYTGQLQVAHSTCLGISAFTASRSHSTARRLSEFVSIPYIQAMSSEYAEVLQSRHETFNRKYNLQLVEVSTIERDIT